MRAVRNSHARAASIRTRRHSQKLSPEFTRKLLALMERIQKADAARNEPIPPKLLQYGCVSLEEGAKLVGCTPDSLRENKSVMRLTESGSERFPLSELLRELRRSRRRAVDKLIRDAEQFIRSSTSLRSWLPGSLWASLQDETYVTTTDIAERLGITKAAARRLVKDAEGIFAVVDARGTAWVTPEELDAYARAHQGAGTEATR